MVSPTRDFRRESDGPGSSFHAGPSPRSQTAQEDALGPGFSGQSTLAGGRGSSPISGDWSRGIPIGQLSAAMPLRLSSGHPSSVSLFSITSSCVRYYNIAF